MAKRRGGGKEVEGDLKFDGGKTRWRKYSTSAVTSGLTKVNVENERFIVEITSTPLAKANN